MDVFQAYIPHDRRLALAYGEALADRLQGAALFADISGFTPLTEALARDFGPQRGAEELTFHLNRIYDALIADVERFHGSVVSFSGDAITCWFDAGEGNASQRAVACAAAMQQVMSGLAAIPTPSSGAIPLAVKAAVASGTARRFLVGDQHIQLIDTLAGALLDRLAAAEHHANKGEILIDTTTVKALGDQVQVIEWRGEEGHADFAMIGSPEIQVSPSPWPDLPSGWLSEEQARLWLLPPVYERLRSGQGEFLAELRPAVSFFLRFTGIDFENDLNAGDKLNAFVTQVQQTIDRYEGALIQLTIGDKGSYLQAAFGAPVAHEDDAIRAFSAALELRVPELDFIQQIQTGISKGRMRAGAYGSVNRRTYGMMSDDVNLAARLMQAATPGQILSSKYTLLGIDDEFIWEDLPDLRVKGKREPIKVTSLVGVKPRASLRLQEPQYSLPMVGRLAELTLIEDKIQEALRGRGQIIGITGAAGMGKSRLVAEAIRLAREHQLVVYGGECQSYGTNTSYLVWQGIWRSFFNIDPDTSLDDQINEIKYQLDQIDPNLAIRLPLLGSVLNLPIADNQLTASLDAKVRKVSLEAMLVNCLRVRSKDNPIVLVLDDCQWLDPLSHDLLDTVGRSIQGLRVFLLVAYRPVLTENLSAPRVSSLPQFSQIDLAEFSPLEARQLIDLKIKQLFQIQGNVPEDLANLIINRSEGNPFYIEELLNYVRDQGLQIENAQALANLELPTSLQSLILSRIDQLTESQKITLKVASVIGRLFNAAMLWGAYPSIGDSRKVINDLDGLIQLDLMAMDAPEAELAYFFKHILTQEVTYESLPFATRAMLHDLIGQHIEHAYSKSIDQYVDLLAFHFDRSQNEAKRREYLYKAGERAQHNYANATAIDYYQRLLPLVPEEEKVAIQLKLGKVLELVGKWPEAGEHYQLSLELAEQIHNRPAWAWARSAQAELLRKQGKYKEAVTHLLQAQDAFDDLGDRAGVGQTLHYAGTVAAQQGDFESSRRLYEQSLDFRRELNDRPQIAHLLNNLGILKRFNGDYAGARRFYEESLLIRRELGDKKWIAQSLNNIGNVLLDQGNLPEARAHLEEALVMLRQVGDPWEIANGLNNLGNVARSQGDYKAARALYAESLEIYQQYSDKRALAYLFEDMSCLAALEGQAERSLRLLGSAASLRESIGSPLSKDEREKIERIVWPAQQQIGKADQEDLTAEGKALTLDQAIHYALTENPV